MYLNPRIVLRLLSLVAIAVGFAFSLCPLNNCAAQEEATVVEKADAQEAIVIESVDDEDGTSDNDKDAKPEPDENYNKPWEEIVSPLPEEEAHESDSNSEAATGKVIGLSSLRWLYPLAFLLITLLVLGWLLALITRFIGRNDKPKSAEAGKTEAEFGHIFLSRPARCDDLTRIQGIDSVAQGRLNAAGIYQIDQLKNMTAGQFAVLGRKVGLPRLDRASFANLGNLTNVASVGTAGAAAVATAALAGTVASITKSKVDSASSTIPEPHFNRKNNLSEVAAHSDSAALTKIDHSVGGASGSATPKTGSSVSRVTDTAFPAGQGGSTGLPTGEQNEKVTQGFDRSFRTLYSSPPSNSDDLTTLSGIDSAAAAKLNAAGIYKFDQLKNLDGKQKTVLATQLGFKEADFNEWQRNIYAQRTAVSATALPAVNISEAEQRDFKGNFGVLYSSRPEDADDLTLLSGIDANAEARLNAAGIYKFDQLKNLSGKQKAVLASRLGFKDSDFSEWQSNVGVTGTVASGVKLSEAEQREFKSNFGVLYSSPPEDADDLTRLSGIDANTAARLNAAGIYKFDQLKNLDDKQEALLATQLKFDDGDFADWRRCMYAWDRGINTSAEIDGVHATGELHGIALPQIADGIFDGEKLVAYPEQIIFRGSNPEGWGRGGSDGIDNVETSLSCDAIRGDINYLRIRRADTRESVVLPMTKGQLFANGDQSENGWNGSSEVFFGGRHIGAFAQQLPQEVETKFGQGGWGFGHRYDHNDRQEWGWAGRVIEPTTFEISVGCAGEVPGSVVFRGSDPSTWNTRSRDGEFSFADPIESVKHPVNFVRIMRHATGEAVIVRVDGNHVLDEGFDPRLGWNGSGAEFSGGMHLGVYHSELPQDFETRFEFGGWGFGHPYDDNDRQAWGWGGRQLPETVFEIMLLEAVPGFMSHEIIE